MNKRGQHGQIYKKNAAKVAEIIYHMNPFIQISKNAKNYTHTLSEIPYYLNSCYSNIETIGFRYIFV